MMCTNVLIVPVQTKLVLVSKCSDYKNNTPTYEHAMSARIVLGAAPRNHWHDGVMVTMQERYLPFFLAQHEEHRVQ